MKWMTYLFPSKCTCCRAIIPMDAVLCTACREQWEQEKKEFSSTVSPEAPYSLVRYNKKQNSVGKQLLLRMKKRKQVLLAAFFAVELGNFLRDKNRITSDMIVVNVPRRGKSVQKYGWDPVKFLARFLAKELELPYQNQLSHTFFGTEQKRLDAVQRKMQTKKKYRLRLRFHRNQTRLPEISGKKILLVDDILTTGATLSACTKLLLENGAKSVCWATVARTF